MHDIGIDLGTATIIVYTNTKGIVLREPSVVAVNVRTGTVLGVGDEAYDMLGKTPAKIQAIRPLQNGVICDYNMTAQMLKHFILKVSGNNMMRPRIAICVPSGITNVEANAVTDVAVEVGASKVYLIEEPVAAAIGAGIDIAKPEGNLVVDIGGGTTDIAVLSFNGVVNKSSVRMAGDMINEAIIKQIRDTYGILIGDRTAEKLKKDVATVQTHIIREGSFKGRDLFSGLPKKVEIKSDVLYEAVVGCVDKIIACAKEVLEKTPPELAGDIYHNGIMLTGGTALLHGLPERMKELLKVEVRVAENPQDCVAIGTGKSFQYLGQLYDGFLHRSTHNH